MNKGVSKRIKRKVMRNPVQVNAVREGNAQTRVVQSKRHKRKGSRSQERLRSVQDGSA
jgi:hypothetical protein